MHKRAKGNIGESVACEFIERKGFKVTDRNYSKKWGELDIIAKKGNAIHFFEVKSVTNMYLINRNDHRPEDNVHGLKIRHIRRMIETYLGEKGRGLDTEFQFHVLCVYMDMERKMAKVKWIENIII